MPSWRSSILRRRVKKSTSNNKIYFLGVILLILMWQLLSLLIGEETMVFPGPLATVKYALYLLGREYTYKCIAATMYKMISGFMVSFLLGLFLGTLAGNFETFEKLFNPTIITLRAIPTASLVYLFIVLAGFKTAPIFLVILISFPIIYEGVMGGVRNIPKGIINATRLDGASFLKENLRIRLPLALPYIIVALASSFSLCFKIEIMAEVITGSSNPGLGSAILGARSSDPTNMVPIFAYSLIAVVIMLILDYFSSFIRNKMKTE